MSDTIKLIIEIPKDVYKAKQHLVANKKWMVGKVDIAIANGIPLEDVKAEIEEMPTDYCGGYIGLDKKEVLQILDRVGKTESEDKPNDNT